MKNVKKRIGFLLIILLFLIMAVVFFYYVLLESAFVKDDSYDSLYTITSQKGSIEIRHDYSALSRDAIVIVKDGVCIDSYDYFDYRIKSIIVIDDSVTLTIHNNSTQSANAISIAF